MWGNHVIVGSPDFNFRNIIANAVKLLKLSLTTMHEHTS